MTASTAGFEEFFQAATGRAPDAGQSAIAATGLPVELRIPSGTDGAATAVLPWLHRRLVGEPDVTPRRLVYVLPAHSLPEQAFTRIGTWLDRLGRAGEVGVHLLAGAVRDGGWLRHPERTAILVGTHDLLLSRALMRGFADSRRMAPVSYGLLHNDAQWVFDAAHRLGPGLATSVRLQQMRDALGTFAPTATVWMFPAPAPVPAPVPASEAEGEAQATEPRAARTLPDGTIGDLAQAVGSAHIAGTQTTVILNSVARARELYLALRQAMPTRDIVLIHPFFRTGDRRDRVATLGDADRERDRIVVGTRALELSFDLASRTLLTEPEPEPEPEAEAGVRAGADLDDSSSPASEAHRSWDESDLLALFDTAVDPPDLDVASWICAPADRTALVAWRAWPSGVPSDEEPDPGREELCPVPLDELGETLNGRAWLRDPQDGLWRRVTSADLAPGMIVLLDALYGGYLPDQGWSPASTAPVPPLPPPPDRPAFACVQWVSLDQHLAETEDEARTLLGGVPGLSGSQREAVILAARYHDLGKCHAVFQEMLRSGGGDPPDVLLAKSKAPYSTGRSGRPHFRHELVSALMLAEGDHWHGDHTDHRLVTYLVAAHHGKVRISVRAGSDEAPAILGVLDGDRTPAVTLSSGEAFPSRSLRTADFRSEAGGTWTDQARALRDRAELGPFRLAYVEALVRIADWRSSARHDGPVEVIVP